MGPHVSGRVGGRSIEIGEKIKVETMDHSLTLSHSSDACGCVCVFVSFRWLFLGDFITLIFIIITVNNSIQFHLFPFPFLHSSQTNKKSKAHTFCSFFTAHPHNQFWIYSHFNFKLSAIFSVLFCLLGIYSLFFWFPWLAHLFKILHIFLMH